MISTNFSSRPITYRVIPFYLITSFYYISNLMFIYCYYFICLKVILIDWSNIFETSSRLRLTMLRAHYCGTLGESCNKVMQMHFRSTPTCNVCIQRRFCIYIVITLKIQFLNQRSYFLLDHKTMYNYFLLSILYTY